MRELSASDYKKYAAADPELIAIIRKSENRIILISDMEYEGDNGLLRIENMFFELDITTPFSVSVVACRGQYAGGITFPIENCHSFDKAFSFFIEQSDSKHYWLIDDKSWGSIINLDFDEAFIVVAK